MPSPRASSFSPVAGRSVVSIGDRPTGGGPGGSEGITAYGERGWLAYHGDRVLEHCFDAEGIVDIRRRLDKLSVQRNFVEVICWTAGPISPARETITTVVVARAVRESIATTGRSRWNNGLRHQDVHRMSLSIREESRNQRTSLDSCDYPDRAAAGMITVRDEEIGVNYTARTTRREHSRCPGDSLIAGMQSIFASLPWASGLVAHEFVEMITELQPAIHARRQNGDSRPVVEILREWEATAEARQNLGLITSLAGKDRRYVAWTYSVQYTVLIDERSWERFRRNAPPAGRSNGRACPSRVP